MGESGYFAKLLDELTYLGSDGKMQSVEGFLDRLTTGQLEAEGLDWAKLEWLTEEVIDGKTVYHFNPEGSAYMRQSILGVPDSLYNLSPGELSDVMVGYAKCAKNVGSLRPIYATCTKSMISRLMGDETMLVNQGFEVLGAEKGWTYQQYLEECTSELIKKKLAPKAFRWTEAMDTPWLRFKTSNTAKEVLAGHYPELILLDDSINPGIKVFTPPGPAMSVKTSEDLNNEIQLLRTNKEYIRRKAANALARQQVKSGKYVEQLRDAMSGDFSSDAFYTFKSSVTNTDLEMQEISSIYESPSMRLMTGWNQAARIDAQVEQAVGNMGYQAALKVDLVEKQVTAGIIMKGGAKYVIKVVSEGIKWAAKTAGRALWTGIKWLWGCVGWKTKAVIIGGVGLAVSAYVYKEADSLFWARTMGNPKVRRGSGIPPALPDYFTSPGQNDITFATTVSAGAAKEIVKNATLPLGYGSPLSRLNVTSFEVVRGGQVFYGENKGGTTYGRIFNAGENKGGTTYGRIFNAGQKVRRHAPHLAVSVGSTSPRIL